MWFLKTKYYCEILFTTHTQMLGFVDQYKIDSFECKYIKTFEEFNKNQNQLKDAGVKRCPPLVP